MVDAEPAAEAEELTDEQKEMMSVMGFSDFTSSKVRCGSLLLVMARYSFKRKR